ncbi:Rhabdoid tumor deletion region protein 1, partial [Ophiophagus hannah]
MPVASLARISAQFLPAQTLLGPGALPPLTHGLRIPPLSSSVQVAAGIVESGLVSPLVQKLKTEKEDIQELILDTLTGCLRVQASEALATGSVFILKEKLRDPSRAIRCKAAEALMAISIPLEGKNMVFKENVFPDLVNLLEDDDSEVRANAAGALMNSAVTTQEAIDYLLPLIHDGKSKVRLYAIKALTMLSEAPEGRLVLLKHVPEFRKHLDDSNATVQRAAQIAIQVIEWKP